MYCQKYLRYCLQHWKGVLADFSVLPGHTELFSNRLKSNDPKFTPYLAEMDKNDMIIQKFTYFLVFWLSFMSVHAKSEQ